MREETVERKQERVNRRRESREEGYLRLLED